MARISKGWRNRSERSPGKDTRLDSETDDIAGIDVLQGTYGVAGDDVWTHVAPKKAERLKTCGVESENAVREGTIADCVCSQERK